MSKGSKYYQLVPEKILEKLPELENSFKSIPGFSLNRLKHVISIVVIYTRKKRNNKSLLYEDFGHWAPLKMVYLRKLIPQADLYLFKLIESGIIDRSGKPIIGVTSYKYRINKDFTSKCKRIQLDDPKLLKRINSFQQSLKRRNSKKYTGQNYFLRQMSILPESCEYIEQITDTKKYNYYMSSVIRIINNDIFCSIDDTSNRFHSNLTILPSVLRQFIRVHDQELINIDVKNCQPYLSIILLTNPTKASRFARERSFSLLLKRLQVKQTEDVKRYISLVKNGEIYEYLLHEFNKRSQEPLNRDQMKKKMLIILFGKNRINPSERKIFSEIFPEVSRVFEIVRGNFKGNKFQNFKRFPILLQKIESHIMLNVILQRIYNEYPGVIALTIHDSIMTANNRTDIEKIEKIMNEEFLKIVGERPTVKEG